MIETNKPKLTDYIFGLRITERGSWKDSSLVVYALTLVRKYRTPQAVSFGLTAAAFLTRCNYQYVCKWLPEMDLSAYEMETNCETLQLMKSKAMGAGKKFAFVSDKTSADILRYAFRAVTEMPNLFDAHIADGFQCIVPSFRRTSKAFSGLADEIFPATARERADECVARVSRLVESVRHSLERNSKLWQRLNRFPTFHGLLYTIKKRNWVTAIQMCQNWPFPLRRAF